MAKRYVNKMAKRYVLDASVFLFAPHALRVFEENEVIIPKCVLSEMMALARKGGEHRMAAIEFGRELDVLLPGPGCTGELDRGGTFSIMGDMNDSVFDVAQSVEGILVSRDPLVRTVARTKGIPAEPFKFELADFGERPYTGRCMLYVSSEEFQKFAVEKALKLDKNREYTAADAEERTIEEDYKLTENEYVVLVNSGNVNQTLLGRYTGRAILPLRQFDDHPVYGVRPRNAGQRFALDALMDPDIPLVILKGPAGTAKSFLSMAAALKQTLEMRAYNRILITRPNTKMDNDVGFLKGDERDKVLPILRGLLDNVENLMPRSFSARDSDEKSAAGGGVVEELMARNVIEAQAMAYMRGRSIVKQYIVADEMQNSTPVQALSITTRLGDYSKIVLCGDTQQIDSPYMDERSNGLTFASERMKGSPLCCQLTFLEKESTRSPLAREAIERMGRIAQF